VLVKLDFSNAFNSLHRLDMLCSIKDALPELYAYCSSSYSQPSFLFYGSFVLLSQEGSQQGDPLGPLLFCNAIHALLTSLKSELSLSYLDDLTLGGAQTTVAGDIDEIVRVGSSMGLHLNTNKCELICHPHTDIHESSLQQFRKISISDSVLLGAPLFPGEALDTAWAVRCDDLSRAVERLSQINSQDALILLRASFGMPRVQYLLRCSPSGDHPSLQLFDKLLREAVSRITNSVLSDTQWLRASLPVKDGGLGVRRIASLALPAYLASAACTISLQESILSEVSSLPDPFFEAYLATWSATTGIILPPNELSHKQPFGIDLASWQILNPSR
jgi:hypothetical protein